MFLFTRELFYGSHRYCNSVLYMESEKSIGQASLDLRDNEGKRAEDDWRHY